MSQSWLEELGGRSGVQLEELGANRPLPLTGEDVWIVVSGKLHLFGQPDSHTRRATFISREAGQAMFGLGQAGVLAVGSPGSRVARMARKTWLALPQAAALLEDWIARAAAELADPPRETRNLDRGSASLEGGEEFGGQRVLFLQAPPSSLEVEGVLARSGLTVLPARLKARAKSATQVEAVDLDQVLTSSELWPALDFYHDWVRRCLQQRSQVGRSQHQGRIEDRERANQGALCQATLRLSTSLPGPRRRLPVQGQATDALLAAVRMVAEAAGIRVAPPSRNAGGVLDPLTQIAQASGFRVRLVKLQGKWWKSDVGQLLAYREGRPLALLRQRPGRYLAIDPEDPRPIRVTPAFAKTLDSDGVIFYRPLPQDCTTLTGLVRFALPEVRRDLLVIAGLSVLGAIMAMATPVALGWLVDTVIPSGQMTELMALGLGLALAAVVTGTANVGQAITALRIGTRVDADVQAAMTDRLLSLPAPFFRRYSSGDLTNRLLGFQSLIQAVTGSMLTAVLATVMSSTNLALMFYYNFWLACIALLMVLLLVSLLAVGAYLDLGLQRRLAKAKGELGALVFQLLGGISKLKVAHAEARAFEKWSWGFTERTRTMFRSNLIQSNINAVMDVYNTTSLIIFIGYLAHYKYKALAVSDFLALTSAYGSFVGSINLAATSLTTMLTTVPLAERFAPILAEQGEALESLPEPGELRGGVELSHVSFRYGPDEPRILKDISLKAEPGEFVAVVGPSGSGKSTVFRLLLGFEKPAQGSVSYDGQDLAGVNNQSVRRQLGVVLQNGQLMPGTILSNIVGSSLLTIEDAWAAAEIAGLADDIKAMPMGMHTVVSEGGGAFSGGQRQRLLIARAVVAKPRLLLLDEATSALDSRTQEEVSHQLNCLQATRVVIAHRLSTIEKADRIYVIKDCRVDQVGTYEELVAVPGTFQELARRQLVSGVGLA